MIVWLSILCFRPQYSSPLSKQHVKLSILLQVFKLFMIASSRWVAIATVFLLVSCKPVPVFTDKEILCKIPPLATSSTSTNSPVVTLLIDGSGSMEGYVTPTNSSYIKLLKTLDSTFDTKVEYYRAGQDPNKPNDRLENRSQFLDAQKPIFYQNTKYPGVSSQPDYAIESFLKGDNPKETERLIIFVTDLEPDAEDINGLKTAIKGFYEKPNHAVGVLGIKSEFSGKIYSTSTGKAVFQHNDEGDANKLRPFYVIFVGNYQAVIDSFEKLKRNSGDLINDQQFVIFSPGGFVSQVASLPETPTPPPEISSPGSLHNGKVAVEVSVPPYNLLEVGRRIKTSKPLEIPYSLSFTPLKYGLLPESITTQTNVRVYESKNFNAVDNNATVNNAIELDNWNITPDNLAFTMTLKPENFPEAGVYLFTIDAIAENLKSPEVSPLWETWNSEQPQEIAQDGSKTYNLSSFMQSLKNATVDLMNEDSKIVGRFCYAIQKN